jgi:hypothetical protein
MVDLLLGYLSTGYIRDCPAWQRRASTQDTALTVVTSSYIARRANEVQVLPFFPHFGIYIRWDSLEGGIVPSQCLYLHGTTQTQREADIYQCLECGFEHMTRACEWQKTERLHALEPCTQCDLFFVTFWLSVIN